MKPRVFKPIPCGFCEDPFIPTSSKSIWCPDCMRAVCLNCGGFFRVTPTILRRGQVYCSKDCQLEHEAWMRVQRIVKSCTRCGIVKRLDEYYEDSRKWDGRFSWCKACFNEHARCTYNPKARRRQRLRWLARPGVREHVREKTREWRRKNKAYFDWLNRSYQEKRRTDNGEHIDLRLVVQRDGYICHICGGLVTPVDVHIDHVVPLSRGGKHALDNLAVAHAECNRRKNNKLMSELVIDWL